MKLKKLLSLFVCLLILVSTMGVFTVSAEDTVDKKINVPVGGTYVLPTEVADAAGTGTTTVTWVDADKNTATAADTTEFGVKLYTGTTGEGNTIIYRVNVGEYKLVMSDDMSTHETELNTDGESGTNTGGAIKGGSLTVQNYYKAGYSSTNSKVGAVQFATENGNKVAAYGQEQSSFSATIWTPSSTTDAFKLSFKMKIKDLNLSTLSNGSAPIQLQLSGKQFLTVKPSANTEKSDLSYLILRLDEYKEKASDAVSGAGVEVQIQNKVSKTVTNGIYSMDEYVEITYLSNSETYSVYMNNELLKSGLYLPKDYAGAKNVTFAKRTAKSLVDAITYIDDIKYSKLVYFEDDLSEINNVLVPETACGSEYEANCDLTLNDGTTTKSVTVKFTPTADASSAVGTIDGFDGTVNVNYTVAAVSNPVIYSYVGDTVTLADGTVIKPDAVGCLERTATDGTSIYNYTIHVGEYYNTITDDMESHTSSATTVDFDVDGDKVTNDGTNTDADDVVHKITFGEVAGFSMSQKEPTSADGAAGTARIESSDDNKYLAIGTIKTASGHTNWTLDDEPGYNFKVSYDVTLDDIEFTDYADSASIINLFNTERQELLNIITRQGKTTSASENTIRAYGLSGTYTYSTTSYYEQKTDGKYKYKDWLTVEIYGSEKTFDVYVEGTQIASDVPYKSSGATGNLSYITISKRNTNAVTAVAKYDNLSVSSYRYFNGTLPSSVNTVVAQKAQAPLTTTLSGLTLSDGSAFAPTASYTVDTEALGTKTAAATVAGFDDTVTVNAKVCNYDVTLAEALTAGSAAKLNIKNVSGNHNSAYLLAAWYESDVLKVAADPVNLSSLTKDASTTSEVLTIPADALSSGKLRVFIITNTGDVKPIDLDADFSLPTA